LDGLHNEEIEKEDILEKDINIQSQSVSRKKLQWLKSIGPGLITGASDDDPSGNIFPSWCTIWFWNLVDGTFSVPHDDSYSRNVCKNRCRYG